MSPRAKFQDPSSKRTRSCLSPPLEPGPKHEGLPPARAEKILAELESIEYGEIQYDVASTDCYGYIQGQIPILLSAPHGAKHLRGNRWKGEDEYTSALAVVVGRLTGAHVLYTKYKTAEDPNYDGKSRYKSLLKNIVREHGIRFLIDLHGADWRRPFKLDVGIHTAKKDGSSCPTYLEIIWSVFKDFQSPLFNLCFPARGQGTITSYCRRELGIEAAQFEMNGKYRVLHRKPDSSRAHSLKEAHYRAEAKDVLEMISRMVLLIQRIYQKMRKAR